MMELTCLVGIFTGSHNSFSSRLDHSSEIGPEESPLIQMLGPLAKGVVYKWSVTQNLDFRNQLSSGIRYFDLRIASRSGSQDIHFVHGLYGTTVEEGVNEILEFLDSNKKEIVILDFNHLYNMNEDQHRIFLNMLVEKCGDKLCLFVGLENLTLNMLWENGLQIIILYHHKVNLDNSSFIFTYMYSVLCVHRSSELWIFWEFEIRDFQIQGQ